MHHPNNAIAVYVEVGKKRTVACAVDWPGWCRVGKDEPSALEMLLASASRFGQILEQAGIPFVPPVDTSQFDVVERLPGNASTNFGAPGLVPTCDEKTVTEDELQTYLRLLNTCYQAFDNAVDQAAGKELRKGPRGGGRNLERIVAHIVESDRSYLRRLAWRFKTVKTETPAETGQRVRQAMFDALTAAVREGLPEKGPRGGKIWPAPYFVRMAAWHLIDHVWEIEDRLQHRS